MEYELEVVEGLDYGDEFFCKNFQYNYDEFEDTSSVFTNPERGITFIKMTKDNLKSIYLSVKINKTSLNVNKKGFYVLLNDKTKLSFPDNEINVEVDENSDGYTYSAFVKLSQDDVLKLKNKLITDVRLYIYDEHIIHNSAFLIQKQLECLIK